MEKRKIVGIISIFVGIFFILNSFSGITGFAVADSIGKGVSGILGLVFVVVGVLVFISAQEAWWDKYRVKLVANEYDNEELNPVQAALKINDKLYPGGLRITGVDYRSSSPTKTTIKTENQNIPINLSDRDKAIDLAIGVYEMAIINDRKNKKNCELHISKTASSKHHTAGLQEIIDDFEGEYEDDLNDAKKKASS